MNNNNTAPVMVELKQNEIVMDRKLVQELLEQTLNLKLNLDKGKSPFDAYRKAMGNAVDMYRFEKNDLDQVDKIRGIQKRVQLIDFYFETFVIPVYEDFQEHVKVGEDAELASYEVNIVAMQG